jgi:hypothetical protein
VTPANTPPGPPSPEEPEPFQDGPAPDASVDASVDPPAEASVDASVDAATGFALGDAADSAGPAHLADSAGPAQLADAANSAAALAAEAEAEAARERAVFDELVASFHTETAPDPVPRKIVRHPVLNPEPVLEQPIVEPSDETTVDKYFPSEHFEPPEPPPLPQTSGATKASWTLLLGGVLFLVSRTLFQWDTEAWTFWLAVSAVFGGIVSLVMRMQPERDDYDDPDNGAVV